MNELEEENKRLKKILKEQEVKKEKFKKNLFILAVLVVAGIFTYYENYGPVQNYFFEFLTYGDGIFIFIKYILVIGSVLITLDRLNNDDYMPSLFFIASAIISFFIYEKIEFSFSTTYLMCVVVIFIVLLIWNKVNDTSE